MYTVYNSLGTVLAHDVDAAEAAETILQHDGNEFEIRKSNGEWVLWVTPFSRNSTSYSGLRSSVIGSTADDEAAARAEIYQKVISNAGRWHGCSVDQV